jgi:hypothetical protein
MGYRTLAEITSATQGVEICLTILLEYGWNMSYYSTWHEYAKEELDEDPEDYADYSILELEGAWSALKDNFYDREGTRVTHDGITAWIEQADRVNDDTWIIFGVSDGENTRYFKRLGFYNSYAGSDFVEGDDSEVFPEQVTVTQWTERN